MNEMRRRGLFVRAGRDPFGWGIKFLIGEHRDGRSYAGQPIVMVERSPMEALEPTFTLSDEEAQVLIDELWRIGLRPTEGHGSAGQLAATEKHLGDMQRIAFRLLNGVTGGKVNE